MTRESFLSRWERVIKTGPSLHEKIAASDPKLARGRVWCWACGASQAVDSAECLRSGWPECCGATMSIDAPDTARKRDGEEGSMSNLPKDALKFCGLTVVPSPAVPDNMALFIQPPPHPLAAATCIGFDLASGEDRSVAIEYRHNADGTIEVFSVGPLIEGDSAPASDPAQREGEANG